MSTGRGIAVANIESVKHGIEKDYWIVARGVMPGGAASSRGSDASSDARPEPPVIEPLASSLASSEREAQRAHPAAGVCQGGAPQAI